jgi:hypothetical protein
VPGLRTNMKPRLVWVAALPRWCPDADVAAVDEEERP